jgi:hypothetical protein
MRSRECHLVGGFRIDRPAVRGVEDEHVRRGELELARVEDDRILRSRGKCGRDRDQSRINKEKAAFHQIRR